MSTNSQKYLEDISRLFSYRRLTLGLAESCTGGLLSSRIVSMPGVSSFYRGALVSYSNEVKERVLKVPKGLLSTVGAVSRPVALRMASGVCQLLDCDWGVAVTGIAGPSGGRPDKPVGTVCFGIKGPGVEFSEEIRFHDGSRSRIQQDAVEHALMRLWTLASDELN